MGFTFTKLSDRRKVWFVDITVFLLVFLLAYTGISKLIDYQNFVTDLIKSPAIPDFLSPVLAVLLPVAEILLAVVLLINKYQKIALLLSFFLFVIFTMYLSFILTFASYVPCSCGGVIASLSWGWHIVLNLFLIFISLVSYYLLER